MISPVGAFEAAMGSQPMGTVRSSTETADENATCPLEESLAEQIVGCTLAEVERELILRTLENLEGNRTQAAIILGISVRGLRDKLRQFREQGVAIPGSNRARRHPVAGP